MKAGPKQGKQGVCNEQEEKDVIGDFRILRGGFGDTAEEETYGYLNDADGGEEDDLADDCELCRLDQQHVSSEFEVLRTLLKM